MTLSQDLREPELQPRTPEAELRAALDRAIEAAGEAGDGPRREPWRFYLLGPETAAAVAWLAARRLEGDVGTEGSRAAYEQWRAVPGWIAVTRLRTDDPDQAERDREACLTAVQRATLSLWSDNIPSNWVPDLVDDSPEFFQLIDASGEREAPVGMLLYGHPERRQDFVVERP